MDALEKVSKSLAAWNGRPVRSDRTQIIRALGPIFAAFPNSKLTQDEFNDMLNVYVKMLEDIDPESLARAVMSALNTSEFMPTIAAIRKAYEGEQRSPGPRNDVDPRTLPPVPTKMFRLDPEEDRRQRMMQLKRTQKWERYY